MNTELNTNELENVNGGNFIDDVKDVLKKLNPFEPKKPEIRDPFMPETPIVPDQPIARGKC